MLSKINLEIVSKCCRDIVSVVYDLVKKVVCFNINKFDRYAMYNVNDLCRVCLKRKTQQEMLSATKTQIEKLLFIGDPNKVNTNPQKINLSFVDVEPCDIHGFVVL